MHIPKLHGNYLTIRKSSYEWNYDVGIVSNDSASEITQSWSKSHETPNLQLVASKFALTGESALKATIPCARRSHESSNAVLSRRTEESITQFSFAPSLKAPGRTFSSAESLVKGQNPASPANHRAVLHNTGPCSQNPYHTERLGLTAQAPSTRTS